MIATLLATLAFAQNQESTLGFYVGSDMPSQNRIESLRVMSRAELNALAVESGSLVVKSGNYLAWIDSSVNLASAYDDLAAFFDLAAQQPIEEGMAKIKVSDISPRILSLLRGGYYVSIDPEGGGELGLATSYSIQYSLNGVSNSEMTMPSGRGLEPTSNLKLQEGGVPKRPSPFGPGGHSTLPWAVANCGYVTNHISVFRDLLTEYEELVSVSKARAVSSFEAFHRIAGEGKMNLFNQIPKGATYEQWPEDLRRKLGNTLPANATFERVSPRLSLIRSNGQSSMVIGLRVD